MNTMLKLVGIGDLKESETRKGCYYRTLAFRPVTFLPNGDEVFNNEKVRTRVVFGAHEDFKADPLFERIQSGELKVGKMVEGNVHHFHTSPYTFDNSNYVTSYTCVCFKHEDPITYANRQLKNYYACVVDPLSGMMTAPNQLDKPVLAEAPMGKI